MNTLKVRWNQKRRIEAEEKKITRHCHVQSSVGEEFLGVEDLSTFDKLRKRVAFLRRPFRIWRMKKPKCLTKPTTRNAMKKKDIQHPIEPLSAGELREAEIWLLRRDETKAYVSRRKLLSLKNSKLAWENEDKEDVGLKIVSVISSFSVHGRRRSGTFRWTS
jgi:hypothetical protein